MKDYAQEFKDAFDNQDVEKINQTMSEWIQEGLDDANLGLALIMLGSADENVEFSKTFEMYMAVMDNEPVNESLFDWFHSTAINYMERRVDDDIGFSEMFNNPYKSRRPSNDYASEFLNLFEGIVENDKVDDLDKLKDIVGEWQENCPQDANMHCAYVILNIKSMDNDEVADRVKKANDLTPGDRNSYPKMLALMNAVCNAKD